MKNLICVLALVAVVVSCLCFPANAIETTPYGGSYYYVDPENGSNSNNGLLQNLPIKSIDNSFVSALNPGDMVLFKCGTTMDTSGIDITVSGEKNKPIIFSCYGNKDDGLPVICGNDDTENAIVCVKNQDYIVIDSLNIKSNNKGTADLAGIKIEPAKGKTCYDNIVKNCIVNGYSGADWYSNDGKGFTGILVKAADYYGFFNGVTIENNEIYDCKALGIEINGTHGGCNYKGEVSATSAKNVVVRNNYLYNIGKDGILVNNSNQPLVEYNVCGKSHSYALNTWHVAMWPFSSYKALFQFNESYDTMTTNDGQGFDCDYQCYYTTFQYNYSHDNTGGFMLICTEPKNWDGGIAFNVGATVRYNISQNDKHNLFCLTCHITDTKIYNNTIYADKGVEKVFFVYSRDNKTMPINTKIYNNIFYTNSGGFTWLESKNTEFKNNLIYGSNSYSYPKNDNKETVDDGIISSGNIYADPMLVGAGKAGKGIDSCEGYKLYKSSPAFDNGLLINDDTNTRDFFGNPVSKTSDPNIGAYNGKYGDVDIDKDYTTTDVLILSKYLVNIIDKSKLNQAYYDVNKDGKVDFKDLLYLRKTLAEK